VSLETAWTGRHPSVAHFEPLFEYAHLPEGRIRDNSAFLASLADTMVRQLPDGPELSAGLRKLLEAKDCFVRAAVLEQRHA
jgi:hypothetical protein